MKKLLLTTIVGIVALACNYTYVQAQADTTYAITPADSSYLKYFVVLNTFDSSASRYDFGELRLRTSGSYSRIYLNTAVTTTSASVNGPGQGEQTTLSAVLTSQPFYIASGSDTIAMFRALTLRPRHPTGGARPSQWNIADKSEFVVQLVRSSDNVVIATLDSIGVDSVASMGTPAGWPYGTSPNNWCRYVFIPTGIRSCSAYVRIKPLRYGSSVNGMYAAAQMREYSASAFYSCGPIAPPATSHTAIMSEKYYAKLITYLDGYYATYCDLPLRTSYGMLEAAQMDSLYTRYYTLICTDAAGKQVYKLIPCESPKSRVYGMKDKPIEGARIMNAAYNASNLRLSIESTMQGMGEVVIYDTKGSMIHMLSQQTFGKGSSVNNVPVSLTNGLYFVALRNPDGVWSFNKFVVE